MARDYGRSIGFKGNFLIEPKPMEPTKHQYDFDCATWSASCASTGSTRTSSSTSRPTTPRWPATRSSTTCRSPPTHGLLGSIDANRGNPQNGWDTDQFPTDLYDTVGACWWCCARAACAGGLNFDAKLRRESTDTQDLFLAHIGGMDAFARGLEVAHALLTESPWETWRKERYASFDSGAGQRLRAGRLDLADLHALAAEAGRAGAEQRQQERYENLLNQYLARTESDPRAARGAARGGR